MLTLGNINLNNLEAAEIQLLEEHTDKIKRIMKMYQKTSTHKDNTQLVTQEDNLWICHKKRSTGNCHDNTKT